MIGKTLAHYKIVEKIGAGGMGEVYLAEDTQLRRRVAIKLISPKLAADPTALARFKQEAQAVAALNHPNIVTIHSVEEADGLQFMTMELVEGETLSSRIRKGGLLLSEVLDIAIPVFDAIGAAHQQGIAHRDLKPGNIMLTNEGRVKVLDFGLAKLVEGVAAPEETWAVTTPVTEEGLVFGTAAYMSPEQAEGKPVDARSDIFSLGVVLYEMATGRRPFGGESRAALVSSILRDDAPSVTDLNAKLPRHFGRIVKLCLVKNPAERFQTAADVRIQLQEVKSEGESASGSPSEAERAPTSAGAPRARGRGALLIALAAIVVAAGTFVFTRLPGSSESDPAPGSAATESDSTFVIAVTPFWGATEEATAEGLVMQALVERQVHEHLGGEDDVRILGKEITQIPRSHEEAQSLGEEIGATAVIWGEVLVLRGDVDIQPYISMVNGDPVGPLPTNSLQRGRDGHVPESAEALEVRLDAPDQLSVRKEKAEDVGNLALLLAAEFYEDRDPDHALGLLRRIDPPSSASMFAEGQIFWDQEDWDTAADRFRKAIELDSTSAAPHEWLGGYHRHEKDWEAELREYEIAASLAPDRGAAWRGVAGAHQHLGDDDAAEVAWRKAIEVDPDDAGTYHFLGHFLDDLERFDESAAAFARSTELAPESSRNHVCFGSSYADRGEYGKALAQYEAALKVNPDASDALAEIGNVHRKQGQHNEAIAFHRRALAAGLAVDEDVAWEHHLLGLAFACADRLAEAEAEFERAVELTHEGRYTWLTSNLDYAATLFATKGSDAARRHAADFTTDLEDDAFRATLLRFYAGTIAEDSVWAAAQDSVPKHLANKQCEAFYYLGVAHLHGLGGAARVAPDTARAVEYFEKCLETELARFDAYDRARASLRRLSSTMD